MGAINDWPSDPDVTGFLIEPSVGSRVGHTTPEPEQLRRFAERLEVDDYKPRYVRMKDLKTLVRKGLIHITHMSDDGEYCRFQILPDGPECGQWCQFGEVLMVVDRDTVHANMVRMAPQLYEEVDDAVQKPSSTSEVC